MVSVFYVIVLEAIICGLMLSRTLYSKTSRMWHLPLYVIVKASVCTYAVYLKLLPLVTPMCIVFSLVYSLVFFKDSVKRKLAVNACGILCLITSNAVKFTMLKILGLTQLFAYTPDMLATISVLCISLLFLCFFTIICTNILCSVRFQVIVRIMLVHLLLLLFIGAVYGYMHMIIPQRFNGLYTLFALFFLFPSVMTLYFSESIVFARKDNYFRYNS